MLRSALALFALALPALPAAAQITLASDVVSDTPLVYTEAVVLADDVHLTAPSVTFQSTVDGTTAGQETLHVTTTDEARFEGDVGASIPPASIIVDGGGTVHLHTTHVETTSLQEWGPPVYVDPPGAETTMITNARDGIVFSGSVEASSATEDMLLVYAGGGVEFAGDVNAGRMLKRFGTLGETRFTSTSRLTAGLGPSVVGTLSLDPGAELAMWIGGATPEVSHDQLDVMGTLDIADAVLTLSLDDAFSPAPGQAFVLLDNDGADAVAGTFAGLPEGGSISAGDVTFEISYVGGTGNDIVLTVAEALPVELARFDAVLDGRTAQLTWETLTETNHAGWDVEHRAAAAAPWTALGRVAGAGTSTTPRRYAFDAGTLAPGRHAFRLRQIDHAGTASYGPEVEVVVAATAGLEAYPNPFNPQTTLRFATPVDAPVRLVLYDALGRRLRVLYDGIAAAGQMQTVHLDAAGLSSGVYFARLEGDVAPATQRLLLAK